MELIMKFQKILNNPKQDQLYYLNHLLNLLHYISNIGNVIYLFIVPCIILSGVRFIMLFDVVTEFIFNGTVSGISKDFK